VQVISCLISENLRFIKMPYLTDYIHLLRRFNKSDGLAENPTCRGFYGINIGRLT
jgi:hypothetical protein